MKFFGIISLPFFKVIGVLKSEEITKEGNKNHGIF